MDITSLQSLIDENAVTIMPLGLLVRTKTEWVVPGEDRLSYTTLVRLAECCREHHWHSDIEPICDGQEIDSICGQLSAHFKSPVALGRILQITYEIVMVGTTSYTIRFHLISEHGETEHATVDIKAVFYDGANRRSTSPPERVYEWLRSQVFRQSSNDKGAEQ